MWPLASSGNTKTRKMPEIPIPAAFDRPTLLSDQDLYLFNEGSNYRMHETMGAHLVTRDQKSRRHVQRLGAECAIGLGDRQLQLVGCAQQLAGASRRLRHLEGFIPGVSKGALYKFHIESNRHSYHVDKADPIGLLHESLRAPLPWCGTSTTSGAITTGWRTRMGRKLAACPAIHLRGPPRLLDAGSRGAQVVHSPTAKTAPRLAE